MSGIMSAVANHSLNILLGVKPVKQRLHHFDEEKCKAIVKEITKLLATSFVKEGAAPRLAC